MMRERGFSEPDIEHEGYDREYDQWWHDLAIWERTATDPNAAQAEKQQIRDSIDAMDRGSEGRTAHEFALDFIRVDGREKKVRDFRDEAADLRAEIREIKKRPAFDADVIAEKEKETAQLDDVANELETRLYIYKKVYELPTSSEQYHAHRIKLNQQIQKMTDDIRRFEPQPGQPDTSSEEEQQKRHTLKRYRNRMKWALWHLNRRGKDRHIVYEDAPDPVVHYRRDNPDDPYGLEV